MSRRIAVLGADVLGGLLAEAIALAGADELVGFVDDRVDAAPPGDAPLLGPVSALAALLADGVTHVAVGIGDNDRRREVSERLEAQGFALATVVHPRAFVSSAAVLAPGVFVEAFASVHRNARLGRGTVLMPHVWVGHDVEIGAFSWASGRASVGGFARLGDGCKLGVGAIVPAHADVPAGTVLGVAEVYGG